MQEDFGNTKTKHFNSSLNDKLTEALDVRPSSVALVVEHHSSVVQGEPRRHLVTRSKRTGQCD